jgi:hypothetical protein
MNKLTNETIQTIRKCWTEYYSTQDELEVQYAMLHKFEIMCIESESKQSIIFSVEDYLEKNLKKYQELVEKLYSYKREIIILERKHANTLFELERLMKENGLQQEDISYNRDLYNLVNGLE